jgi:hypothetical protein
MSNDKATFVTIGCKLPHGLIIEARDNSGEIVRVTLNGANAARIVGGYGITENVPADVWNAWLKKHAKFPAVINGQVFVHTDLKSVEGEAKNRRNVASGFESIDPIKNGMLKGADGQDDKEALKTYQEQVKSNPDRFRQRVE